jgi:DNA ligase-1
MEMCVLRLLASVWLVWFMLFAPARAEPSALPPLTLAEVYHADIDPAAYWVSEKLDGVRAYWDGQRLYFRSGVPVSAPDWFTRDFPRQAMDGELWLGRGTFERLSGIVRKTEPVETEWREVRYMLFELPGASGSFSARIVAMRALVAAARVPWLKAIDQFRVADRKALQARLDEVVAAGGEGLMLHRADAIYAAGRSGDLLKFKPYLDADATVVGHLPGKGRHAGRMGALSVEDDAGHRFRIGTGFSDAQRDDPPALGSRVIYRYRGLTAKGLPRFPVFLRVREAF